MYGGKTRNLSQVGVFPRYALRTDTHFDRFGAPESVNRFRYDEANVGIVRLATKGTLDSFSVNKNRQEMRMSELGQTCALDEMRVTYEGSLVV